MQTGLGGTAVTASVHTPGHAHADACTTAATFAYTQALTLTRIALYAQRLLY